MPSGRLLGLKNMVIRTGFNPTRQPLLLILLKRSWGESIPKDLIGENLGLSAKIQMKHMACVSKHTYRTQAI